MLISFQEANIAVGCIVSPPNITTTRLKSDETGKVPNTCLTHSRVHCTYAPCFPCSTVDSLFSFLLSVQYLTALSDSKSENSTPWCWPPHYNTPWMLNMFFSSAHSMFTKKRTREATKQVSINVKRLKPHRLDLWLWWHEIRQNNWHI